MFHMAIHQQHYWVNDGKYFCHICQDFGQTMGQNCSFVIFNSNNCSFSFSFEVEEESVSSQDIYRNLDDIYLYPNPALDRVFLSNLTEGEVSYYELTNGRPLQVEMNGSKRLRILSRLVFDPQMGEEETYRLRVKSGSKVLGTYFMSTEQSSAATIQELTDKVMMCSQYISCNIHIVKLLSFGIVCSHSCQLA